MVKHAKELENKITYHSKDKKETSWRKMRNMKLKEIERRVKASAKKNSYKILI